MTSRGPRGSGRDVTRPAMRRRAGLEGDAQEKLDLRQHLHEAKQQLLQQAEYCTEMGAAVCTLLWGVSSNEEAVKTILGGSKAAKFFTITAQTMESFVKSLSEDMKQQDLDSDENQFVLALAGIVTNVAALACGREFLVTSSRELLDTMVHLLGDMKPGLCTKFKVLMLMSLYNVSINLKGLKYISESPGFIPLLWWLLNGTATPNQKPHAGDMQPPRRASVYLPVADVRVAVPSPERRTSARLAARSFPLEIPRF